MKMWMRCAPVMLLLACAFAHAQPTAPPSVKPARPVIQLAILLDTSNSMDGLINQARAQLWNIVNEFTRARRNGHGPELQLALYQYGNDGLPAAGGHIQLVLPFTTDLDKVSEKLFALTTNGGQEYCGQVIGQAVRELTWSPAPDVMKLIFIAGNEPFSQGKVDYHITCKASIGRGIVVNTIHCGTPQEGAATGWKDGALLTDGRYFSIDMNQRLVDIPTPQDAKLLTLNTALNATYLPYGVHGEAGKRNQNAQDANAAKVSPTTASARAATKSTAQYANTTWDLVDAVKSGTVKLEAVKDADLPPQMRKMTLAERQTYLTKQTTERARVQTEIGKLNTARTTFLAANMKKRTKPGEKSLQDAILTAIHLQAAQQHYTFTAPGKK